MNIIHVKVRFEASDKTSDIKMFGGSSYLSKRPIRCSL